VSTNPCSDSIGCSPLLVSSYGGQVGTSGQSHGIDRKACIWLASRRQPRALKGKEVGPWGRKTCFRGLLAADLMSRNLARAELLFLFQKLESHNKGQQSHSGHPRMISKASRLSRGLIENSRNSIALTTQNIKKTIHTLEVS
jgi:hypothetical protein